MTVSVDWDMARDVAGKVSGGLPPLASWRTGRRATAPGSRTADRGTDSLDPRTLSVLDSELSVLTAQAEELVEAETGLRSLVGPARSRVTDRAGWVEANLASFDRMMRPLLAKLTSEEPSDPGWLSRFTGPIGPKLAGAEMGALLGWMSTRVIGQYDLLIIEDERPEEQDWVYYVGPNVVALEDRYGLSRSEFRLWVAIHECTHRAQFTAVPWLRPYFLSLVTELVDSVDPDPERLFATMRSAIEQRRSGRSNAGGKVLDGGIARLLASPGQQAALDKVSGLMSLLEGHGDVTMDRAGRGLIPSQPRLARIMTHRRQNASGPSKVIQRLLGFEAKLAQYAEGEAFIVAVEAAGGRELFDQVWVRAEHLPTIAEIREPQSWIARVGASGSV